MCFLAAGAHKCTAVKKAGHACDVVECEVTERPADAYPGIKRRKLGTL